MGDRRRSRKTRKTKSAACTHKILMPNLCESSKNTHRLDVEFVIQCD